MILTLGTATPRRRFIVFKDVLDRVLALIGILALLPILSILCLAVRLGSRGPVFFRQERVGRDGKHFHIVKLRTMVVDAESTTGPVWAQDNDPRVTRIGKFLRMSHLDEIPQLFNVLVGNMSLVGPRPERPMFVAQFKEQIPNYSVRLSVKPGITGLAQVYHTYDSNLRDVRKKLAYDILYIKRMCLMTDLTIIFLTIRCLTGRGAK